MLRPIVFLVVLLLVLAVAGALLLYGTVYSAAADYGDGQDFTVIDGESFGSVAIRLEQEGFIPSALILQIYARLTGADSSVQRGAYVIPGGLSPLRIVTYLSSGRQNLVKVTIPEGKTLRQVAAIFEGAGITSAEEFKAAATNTSLARGFGIPAETLEGYLYPDTYYFAKGYSAHKIVEHMATVFFEKLAGIVPHYKELSALDIHEKVTMASIVEREYRSASEAPRIASVFYNRLDRGIRLESCATVVYVMTEIEGLEHPERIFFADLERSSNYNTYYRQGLPPSPIAGVGAVSLSASFFPAQTDYLFFVLESPYAEEHVFSRNYREHLIASESYYVKLN